MTTKEITAKAVAVLTSSRKRLSATPFLKQEEFMWPVPAAQAT